MSEAVSSNHDPDLRLPKATKTKKIPVEQANLTSQSGNVASGESLQKDIADWQSVEFPDAISLAELSDPVLSVSEPESHALTSRDHQSKDHQAEDHQVAVRNLVHQLQQENSMFRAQVGQLERDLAQSQVELQLEVTRFYCKESEATAIPQSGSLTGIAAQSPPNQQELSAIHRKISQLSQELDSSQKMGHRQQILVETLNEQLESGQERIAHLERDCAITQQRYNEQVQLVLQAENVCRDLRMRLHRQQRQALQFKAALEKSLEMGSVQGEAIAQSDLISPGATDAATSFIPKVQPVQPWSQVVATDSRDYANCRGEEHGLLNLFSKLLIADQQPVEGVEVTPIQEVELASFQAPLMMNQADQATEVDTVSVPLGETLPASPGVITSEDVSQYMSLMFPRQIDSPAQSPAVAPAPQEAVFDVSPFLEAGEADLMNTPAVVRPIAKNVLPPLLHPPRSQKSTVHQPPPVETPSPSPALSQPGDREDNLWADLAKLIEPDLLLDESTSPSDLSNQTVEQVSVPSNPFQSAANLISDQESDKGDRRRTAKPLSLDFFAYIEKKATHTQNTEALNPAPKSANANLADVEKKTAAPEETLESSPSLPSTSDKLNPCPSPILYPFRPAKKLHSMSAVDLPSFRHAAN